MFIPNRSDAILILNLPPMPLANLIFPPGTGGGCVTTGPFANLQVPFGEVSGNLDGSLLNNPKNLDFKPHCLRRDLNPKIAASSLTSANVETLLQSPNVTEFNRVIDYGTNPAIFTLHGGGHLGE